ncbi:MAG: bifunctional diaminohydroxyphosphoribosylaminopyrimidine deaminase/5-amino-6-(5-phosphoribosylamino)uracil reductase RibD [Candidatus Aminicenantes bacterium]|nr:bifunctional diaminohydroxyphosphoribosylaminopyrimidine deaminase/5-amino-6-(5-phosphoribosylamino)uracil reductase RibD [Candidatus Aminicenantes bacterium]
MKPTSEDLSYMEMAFSLARKARGRTSPNPCVGAVIVKDGRIVGWGYHQEAGQPHAEIIALERAGKKAQGATLYLTLEPCVHWGRTPPCADRLVRAGFKRAVIASTDPNPVVHSKGVSRLKEAGVEVTCGLLAEKNSELNEAYNKYIVKRTPFVTLKFAVSLDGKMATFSGDSHWISSPESRQLVHHLRFENDAVLVGIGTVLKDNPLLTVRLESVQKKKWLRVILDTRLRIPPESRLLQQPENGRVMIFCGPEAPEEKIKALQDKGAEVILTETENGKIKLKEVLKTLGQREVTALLVEGGSKVLTSFLEERLADKVIAFISPRLIGGETAATPFEGQGVEKLAEALELKNIKHLRLKHDIIIEGYL